MAYGMINKGITGFVGLPVLSISLELLCKCRRILPVLALMCIRFIFTAVIDRMKSIARKTKKTKERLV